MILYYDARSKKHEIKVFNFYSKRRVYLDYFMYYIFTVLHAGTLSVGAMTEVSGFDS